MTPIALPTVLDLAAASRLLEALKANVASVTFDGSHVERIGVSGLQLLLSARATSVSAGQPFHIERASGPLQAAARTAGAGILLASSR